MKTAIIPLLVLATSIAAAAESPKPYGATPSPRQLAHQELELFAFCHFTVDTFTDREWGTGGESETVFNPTAFDADQIVRAMKAGGLNGRHPHLQTSQRLLPLAVEVHRALREEFPVARRQRRRGPRVRRLLPRATA